MYQDLYEYLILNKQLNVPGIGTFFLERKPAGTDVIHRQISPPMYTISLLQNNGTPTKRFFYWLADRSKIHYHEAIVRFNGFIYEMKNQLLSGHKIIWEQVGTLSKGMSGEIKFDSSLSEHNFDAPVSAPRIIREKAVHTVRVGEDERTSAEMSEWLHPEEEKKTYWWAPALIAAIVVLIFIGIHVFQKGINQSSTGNQRELSPQKASDAYKLVK
jgi:hypothetical protein